jgi:acyl dehydratase
MGWSIVARNLAEHANNAIHTDEGAKAAGYPAALVAGVTSYAYALHPVIERFGDDWIANGSATVRFRSPVFDGDHLRAPTTERSDGGIDVGLAADRSGADKFLVDVSAWPSNARAPFDLPAPSDEHERLRPHSTELVGRFGALLAERAGDDTDPCARNGIVHPAVWPALANEIFHAQLVRGSWIHTRSDIVHHRLVRNGEVAHIDATVVERYRRGGERAVALVVISVAGEAVATLRHEAIIDLAEPPTPTDPSPNPHQAHPRP